MTSAVTIIHPCHHPFNPSAELGLHPFIRASPQLAGRQPQVQVMVLDLFALAAKLLVRLAIQAQPPIALPAARSYLNQFFL